MKKQLFAILLAICAGFSSVNAQAILFDSTNAPKSGTHWFTVNCTIHSAFTAGPAGAGQKWVFDTTLHHADTSVSIFNNAGSLSFHKKYPKSPLYFFSVTSTDSAYELLHTTHNGLYTDGLVDNRLSAAVDTAYNASGSQMVLPFGITYKDSVKSQCLQVNTFYYTGGFELHGDNKISVKYTADGYGSVKTPNGLYKNVLRLRQDVIELDTFFLDSSGVKGTAYNWATIKQTSYLWVQNDPMQPIVMSAITDSLGNVQGAYYTYKKGLSVREVNASVPAFNIYPNPAGHMFTISPGATYNTYQARLYNLMGQLVWTADNLMGNAHVPTALLPDGHYLCQVIQNGNTTTQKLVIHH